MPSVQHKTTQKLKKNRACRHKKKHTTHCNTFRLFFRLVSTQTLGARHLTVFKEWSVSKTLSNWARSS